jgi:hypothetical protein
MLLALVPHHCCCRLVAPAGAVLACRLQLVLQLVLGLLPLPMQQQQQPHPLSRLRW